MVSAAEKDYVLEMEQKSFWACPEDCALPSVLATKKSKEQWLADTNIQAGACRNAGYHKLGIDIFPTGKRRFWVNNFAYCPFRQKYSLSDDILPIY